MFHFFAAFVYTLVVDSSNRHTCYRSSIRKCKVLGSQLWKMSRQVKEILTSSGSLLFNRNYAWNELFEAKYIRYQTNADSRRHLVGLASLRVCTNVSKSAPWRHHDFGSVTIAFVLGFRWLPLVNLWPEWLGFFKKRPSSVQPWVKNGAPEQPEFPFPPLYVYDAFYKGRYQFCGSLGACFSLEVGH